MPDLPSGTVTFLFSDVEGSTQLLEEHGAGMGAALARHHAIFEEVVAEHGGGIFETVGDAVYAAFADPSAAVAVALDAHRRLAAEDWGPVGRLAVRIAIHTGQVEQRGAHYFGPALFRAARLQALGYGEQTLLSDVTARLVIDALPDDAALRDLGTHRLKDLGEPEHVYQLLHPSLLADFPPLRSLDSRPHNLPLQISSFVGRDGELAELAELLGEHRLITLVGPGGIGKTRLALQFAAQQLERFDDGVFLVDLAGLRDPELVPAAIATALGLREHRGRPIRATIADHLQSRSLLLVLDNVEQLLPGCTPTVTDLLTAAGRLRILATSRASLRIRGEREFTVPSLETASNSLRASPAPAVALFVERARAAGADVELDAETNVAIAGICDRLDGLPLAIELAAARLRVFGLVELAQRLTDRFGTLGQGARDLPDRQRTLRAAVAWSEELLPDAERRLFRQLGVFVGGFTLDAAEAVASPKSAIDVPDALSTLLEHSLLRRVGDGHQSDRYRMLETIREFALERLDASGDLPPIRERHADHFLKLGREHDATGGATDDSGRFTRLEHELDNLWQALDWLRVTGRTEDALRLATGLGHFWSVKGHLIEGRRRFAQLLPGAPPNITRADALNSAAMLAVYTGDVDSAVAQAEEALALHKRLGSRRGVAYAHFVLGQAAGEAGAFERARGEFEDARRSFLELGDEDLTMAATRLLAWSCNELGDTERGRSLHEENLELARGTGNDRIEAETLSALGLAALDEERIDDALALLRDSLQIHLRLDDIADIALDLGRCALARALQGSPVVAAELVGKCEALLNEIGFKRSWIGAMNERTLAAVLNQLPADAADEARERGARLSLATAVGVALGGSARNYPRFH